MTAHARFSKISFDAGYGFQADNFFSDYAVVRNHGNELRLAVEIVEVCKLSDGFACACVQRVRVTNHTRSLHKTNAISQ